MNLLGRPTASPVADVEVALGGIKRRTTHLVQRHETDDGDTDY